MRAAERVLDAPTADDDALWLLAGDTAPEPDALDALVATLETAQSVAIAGPKLMRVGRARPHRGLGRTMTRSGGACRSSPMSSTRASTTG